MVLTKDQLIAIAKINAYKPVKQAKAAQAVKTRTRKGYVKALPISPLTPLASQSRWALLAQGTDASRVKACDLTDARPKASLGDRRLMRDTANISQEDILYKVDRSLGHIELFIEFLKIRKLRADRESATALEGRLNAQEYRLMKRALNRGDLERVSAILERAMNLNTVKI